MTTEAHFKIIVICNLVNANNILKNFKLMNVFSF